MKTAKKVISLLLCLALFVGVLSTVGFAVEKKDIDFKIDNPYKNVNWATYKQYKTDLHSHTTQSDGSNTIVEQVEEHYKYGFDNYALSDHGTTSYTWTDNVVVPSLKVALSVKEFSVDKLECLGESGVASNGKAYTVSSKPISDAYGDTEDFYWQEGDEGHKMMRVPYAIENNPTSLNNAHVNSWFVDYGHGVMGGTSDYETVIKNVDELGGLSLINHPGEYTNARDEKSTSAAYDYSDTHYKYVIDKYTTLLAKYPSCLGIDMNSKGDSRTRYDRKLWDILLMNLAPDGRNVFGLCSSDSHNENIVYSGYVEMLMPEQSVSALKTCMANGEFFGVSKYLGNPEELTEIANYCINSGSKKASRIGQQILDGQKADAGYKYEVAFEGRDGADFVDIEAPTVNGIYVDDTEDTITLATRDDLCIRWIADGKTIAYGSSIDLDDYSDQIGAYVRAEIFGEGGIVYVEPFVLSYNEAPVANVNNGFVDFWFLASALPDTIVKFLTSLEIFKVIWEAIAKI